MKGEIHSLYQEAIYACTSEKLSYDIIALISLIDRVKNAALRLIRNELHMVEMAPVTGTIASNANLKLPEAESSPIDNDSAIIAGGCSGFEPNTDLIIQPSIGIVTAALQLQRGGIHLSSNNDISNPVSSDRPVANPPLGAPSIDQSIIPVITQSDPLITSNSFNSSGSEGEVILGDVRVVRLAIELYIYCRFSHCCFLFA